MNPRQKFTPLYSQREGKQGDKGQKVTYWQRFVSWIGGPEIARRVGLAVSAVDDFRDRQISGSRIEGERDRYVYDREEVLRDALDAWRLNPLARRIVSITSEYIVGAGVRVWSEHEGTNAFLEEWWNHRLNTMDIRLGEWCDELIRSGELFVLLSTDAGGMTYLRAVPALEVGEIETADNDMEQERLFRSVQSLAGEGPVWVAYDPEEMTGDDGLPPVRMIHYAINRPVGGLRGESDLAPVLRWVRRHGSWLEDRVRLNRYRQAFLYVVKRAFRSEGERLTRQAELNANPPEPGTILVVDESETWETLFPQLSSFEAAEDGLALKKMIAAGVGLPIHFIAEPESSTRTTAEAAGGPAFRHLERRQRFVFWMIEDLARIALQRRGMVDGRVDVEAHIHIEGTDIFSRDNASLGNAGATVLGSWMELRREGMIDDAELLRMSYKFAGETVDLGEVLAAGKAAPPLPSVLAAQKMEKEKAKEKEKESGEMREEREEVEGG